MIVSIDPGTTTAAAVFTGPTPGVGSFVDPPAAFALEFLTWAKAEAERRGERLVLVVEDQYAKIRWVKTKGPRKGERLQPTIDLPALVSVVRSAEVWVVCARLLGIEVVRVLPSVWQGLAFQLVPKAEAKAAGGNWTKELARRVVALEWPEFYRFTGIPDRATMKWTSRANEHIRDAMLIGYWGRRTGVDR